MDKRQVAFATAALALPMLVTPAHAQDFVVEWNRVLLDVTRAQTGDVAGPGPIARSGAILHAAIFDAVNAVDGQYNAAAVNIAAPVGANKHAAAASAGYQTLSTLYGSNAALQSQFDALYNAQINSIAPSSGRDSGIALGNTVANAIIAGRSGDGHDNTAPYVESSGPGHWRNDYPPFLPAWGPNWGNVTPWVLDSGDQFRPDAAPALTSQEYTDNWNEVYNKGRATGSTRTADETEIAWFWGNDRDGTMKPPGHMNLMTQVISADRFAGMNADERLSESARLFAKVNVGMLEASIAAWDSKFNSDLDLWRPIAGIREADTDGNPDTFADPTWEPLSHAGLGGDPFTPAFPAYVSGHATFGAVTAAILEDFFGTDDISFVLGTDDFDAFGAERSFDSLSEAAWENAISRVFLGVHWRFDAEAGFDLGYDVGNFVNLNFLTVVPAPSVGMLMSVGGLLALRRRREV